jgi:hypothetical protein
MPATKKPARGSKTKWIEEAINTGKTMPKEIQTWIEETHGVEVGTNYISGQKAAILKKFGKKKGRPKGSKNKPKVEPASSGASNRNVTGASFNGDAVTLIQAVKAAALKAGGLKRLQAVVNDLVEIAG